jgi:hypothetical protein
MIDNRSIDLHVLLYALKVFRRLYKNLTPMGQGMGMIWMERGVEKKNPHISYMFEPYECTTIHSKC